MRHINRLSLGEKPSSANARLIFLATLDNLDDLYDAGSKRLLLTSSHLCNVSRNRLFSHILLVRHC